ncbi:MAG: MFS transporter [Lachnospiraceae bacterium]|nr:MFS transporter [Lachnospiraceae bacterium]
MDKKKSRVFQLVICVFICGIIALAAILNAYSFMYSSVEAVGENKAVILSQLKGTLEYGLKYGKELDNYYDIEDIFEKIQKYCESEQSYIVDNDLKLLYGEGQPDDLSEKIAQMETEKSQQILWVDGNTQHILQSINGAYERAGYIGITCSTEKMKAFSHRYVRRIYMFALAEALIGILLFLVLFRLLPHRFKERRLKFLIMAAIIVTNVISILPSYFVLKAGYEALSSDVAQSILAQNSDDINRIISEGVNYSDIKDSEVYYKGIADLSEQIDSVSLSETEGAGDISIELAEDENGEKRYLNAVISTLYYNRKLTVAVLNTLVTTITAIMISIEILSFLLGLLVDEDRERRKLRDNSERKTIENPGLVRGLSFFFSAFRYMAVAFMSIVLAEIYQPIYVFGKEIPYEILMSLPLSGQVFISMITSYISGIVIHKFGWKKTSLAGILIMILGTLASAFAKSPVPFILAQMLVGTGLGFAKMGIDIYAVAVSSDEDMPEYTAGANAGIIVGFSSSAALGALIANIFGYSGAYIVMSVLGVGVLMLVMSFGMNVAPQEERPEETESDPSGENSRPDLRFPAYILFIIIPYFFIMMFVDYFFPVYANSEGITTDAIGYVMLIYGIVTAYIGTPLCPKLTKKMDSAVLMPVILLILAGSLFAFSIRNFVVVAAVIVALIGIADGIMPSIQFMYVYDLPFSKRIGFSKALGIEGFFSSMIGAAAPVIFGVVMMYGNGGLALIAILIAICAVVFMLMNGIIGKKGGNNGGKKPLAMMLCVVMAGSLIFNTVEGRCATGGDRGKLKIGYCQAGDYYEFDYQLYQIGMGLQELGEIAPGTLDGFEQGDSAADVWAALCESESEHYEFTPECYIDTASLEFSTINKVLAGEKLGELISSNDIDLMITMGTSAGTMVRDCSDVPYMNFIASDPVSSEITGGVTYSGDPRKWAHVSTGVEEKALDVMDDIFDPDKLGIVYSAEDPEAYIYSGAASLDEYAKANRKKVVTEFVTDEFEDTEEAYQNYKKEMLEAHEKLASAGIDLYILTTSYLRLEDFDEVLQPFMEHGIPVFSINSTEDVRCGALAAVEMFDYKNIGRFAAGTMRQYREGASLDELSQEYLTSPFLVLNIDTIRRTGVKMSLETLLSASKIYKRYGGETQ